MTARRIAIVVQRYGPDVHGGAESAARWLAENLVRQLQDDVHVLTTCANDFTTWTNVYTPGHSQLNGVHVHRFTVDAPRDWQRAQRETGRFLLGAHTIEQEMDWIRREGPFCSDLLRHVAKRAADYDAFIFFTYLYATTFFTLPLVAEKAILVPAAHDEPFLYLDAYRVLLHLPRHIVYLTDAEKELVQRVAGNEQIPSTTAAIGLASPPSVDGERFRQQFDLQGDFLLYGGRISEAKNVPQLLDYFQRYGARRRNSHGDDVGTPLKLALMGRPHMPLPDHPSIVALGFLSDAEKFDALKAATFVVLPSLFESLSIMILESWLVKTPVLVNGRSEVLKRQAQLSNGGIYYSNYAEFEAALDVLLGSSTLRQSLGQQGYDFVTTRYRAADVMSRYDAILDSVAARRSSTRSVLGS